MHSRLTPGLQFDCASFHPEFPAVTIMVFHGIQGAVFQSRTELPNTFRHFRSFKRKKAPAD